jgi:hypothetical protein
VPERAGARGLRCSPYPFDACLPEERSARRVRAVRAARPSGDAFAEEHAAGAAPDRRGLGDPARLVLGALIVLAALALGWSADAMFSDRFLIGAGACGCAAWTVVALAGFSGRGQGSVPSGEAGPRSRRVFSEAPISVAVRAALEGANGRDCTTSDPLDQ